jgi:D-alanine-D-alanine ligase
VNQAMIEKFGRVGLLYGGTSSEREVSLMSGAAIQQALLNLGVDVVAIDAGDNLLQALPGYQLDRVFIALHGVGGEDGTLQGALEYLNLPYTGSGVLASALAMDKLRCKQMWQGMGLPTTDFALLQADSDWAATLERLGGSVMQLEKAWRDAAATDSDQQIAVIAEPLLPGPEYTVAILDGQLLPSIRIESNAEFYDYQAKYFSDETQYLCPSELSENREQELQTLCLKAFNSVGCRGWGRVDVMVDGQGNFQLLEVNTVPGMTSHSLVPMAAKASGLSFDQLVEKVLEVSL